MNVQQSTANGSTMPWHQPILDQPHALCSHQDPGNAAGYFPLAEPTYDSGYQYQADASTWNYHSAPDTSQLGAPFFDTVLPHNQDLSNEGFTLELVGNQIQPALMPNITAPSYEQQMVLDMGMAQLFPAPNPMMAPAASATGEERIRCPRGCRATFRRGGDYRRHMQMHTTPRYKCPIFDCDMTFYRADKLRDHARQGHKDKNPFKNGRY
jgi:hypothetical protein